MSSLKQVYFEEAKRQIKILLSANKSLFQYVGCPECSHRQEDVYLVINDFKIEIMQKFLKELDGLKEDDLKGGEKKG